MQHLTFHKNTSWEEVFQTWKENEGADPVWQRFAKEEKGWDTWEGWRGYQASLLGAAEREWALYTIDNPNSIIPHLRLGPFKGWQQHFEKKLVHTFADLVEQKTEWVKNNIGVKNRRENFPKQTQFIGLYLEQEDLIMMYEGHHRAAAVALATYEKDPIRFEAPPQIALTTISDDPYPLLKRLLETPTSNPYT